MTNLFYWDLEQCHTQEWVSIMDQGPGQLSARLLRPYSPDLTCFCEYLLLNLPELGSLWLWGVSLRLSTTHRGAENGVAIYQSSDWQNIKYWWRIWVKPWFPSSGIIHTSPTVKKVKIGFCSTVVLDEMK